MTHSQYLLPGLPDLLKSHRLSYKKFLHNGIDEEFDLLSAKTELNEEEIFYEGLKLNHIDELSPSQVESLDYIYHAEEKIFLVPKRTLEDSLRGRQSHSFHLFIPLEVKILPFQDELDRSYFSGGKFLKSSDTKNKTAANRTFSLEGPVGSELPPTRESASRQFLPQDILPTSDTRVLRVKEDFLVPQNSPAGVHSLRREMGSLREPTSTPKQHGEKLFTESTPHVFFRGESGSPLSETKKEFFQAALSFFFQQSKIQKICITKRFLLLRWFCEKLQHLEPSLASDSQEKFSQFDISLNSLDQCDLIFAKFDNQTKTKLSQLYENMVVKLQNQTKKRRISPVHRLVSAQQVSQQSFYRNSLEQNSIKTENDRNVPENEKKSERFMHSRRKLDLKRHIKVFQKTSRWTELIAQIRVVIGNKGAYDMGSRQEQFSYPQFPNLSVRDYQAFFYAKKPKLDFQAFDKNFPIDVAEKAYMKLPGFNFKTVGLTAGRESLRPTALPESTGPGTRTGPSVNSGSGPEPQNGRPEGPPSGQVALAAEHPGTRGSRSVRTRQWQSVSGPLGDEVSGFPFSPLSAQSGETDIIRFGTIENTKVKKRQALSQRSLRANKLFQKVTFIRRIVQAKQLKNQKNKLHEIFLSTFPPIQEKKGLRFWKLQNGNLLDQSSTSGPFCPQNQEKKRESVGSPFWSSVRSKKIHTKGKFLKHFKTPFHSEPAFHFLSVRELRKILKTVSTADPDVTFRSSMAFDRNPVGNPKGSGTEPTRPDQTVALRAVRSGFTLPHSGFNSFSSKFLSLPQNETGSLWKILPKKSFAPSNDKNFREIAETQNPKILDTVGLVGSARLRFQCYQLQKLAYRQRNMCILHPENFTQKPSQMRSTRLANKKGERRKKEKQKETQSDLAKKVKKPVEKRSSPEKLLGSAGRSLGPKNWQTPGKSQSRPGLVKKLLQKRFIFDRFFLNLKERQALHLQKSLRMRENVACSIEKKSANLQLLPGLEFWEKYHSEKRIEEYWELLLQPYRKKIPSRLLVSIPSGEVVFVKSEKDSRPKELKTKSRGLLFNDLREQSFQGKGSKLLFRSKNQMLWILELMNMKFFAKKILQSSPELVEFFWTHRFRFLWEALSEPSAEQIGQCPEDGGTACPDPKGATFLAFKPEDSLLEERKNLPKVCSDLRKLLATFTELMFREIHKPQKFFLSGQVGKKEWPFQKDGSKSYFALLNLGKMPFMTKQGHFLINGSGRVLVSQIAKCPNFYTKMKIDSRGRPRYWTEFVSSFKNAGEWIQFHIDLENKMFFSLGTKRKYSIFIFLGALGISPSEIPDVIEHWDFLKQSIHKEAIPIDKKKENFLTYLVEPLEVREARILFHDTQNYNFFPGGEKTDEELQKFFEDIFYNPSRYFLGHAGREALNQRRRFSGVPSRSRALEKEDFLAAINALIEVRLGLAPPDDIDHLKFRRVRLPGELLQNEFHLALEEIFTFDFTKFREGPLPGDALESQPKEQRRTIFPTLYDLEQKIFEKGRPFAVSKTVGIQSTYQVSPLEKRMRNFFHTGQLSQYMDQTNPLAEITHKRRLTSLGPDGLPKQVGVAVRELHPSHFGRICPIETPEGLNAGLVASLSSQAKIGSHHTLLAPYYWVKDQTREFPQKIFNNEIFAASKFFPELTALQDRREALQVTEGSVWSGPVLPIKWAKYPPLLPEVIFLSASAEDSVYICSEDYWFSSKYKNFETIVAPPSQNFETNGADLSLPDGAPLRQELARPMAMTDSYEFSSQGTLLPLPGSGKYTQIDSKNSLVKFQTVFPARYQQEFFTVTKSQIDFFGICPTQMISVGTSLIPFLEHDDANRALMGSNMQRQALPLLVLERPLVGTGSEKGVAQSSNSVLLSEFSGQVSFADGRKIVVDSFPKRITSFPESLSTKQSRLLLGSSDGLFPGTKLALSGPSAGSDRQEVLDFGSRNLFQKFQNRTEDGNVKTFSRIFTVKIKIQRKPDQNSKVFTARKVFPISDEEYERSRNLLRREFFKKYKEIHRKKIFPLDFWPGERWKKTGDIWKQKTGDLANQRNMVFAGKAESLSTRFTTRGLMVRESTKQNPETIPDPKVARTPEGNRRSRSRSGVNEKPPRDSARAHLGQVLSTAPGTGSSDFYAYRLFPAAQELRRIRYKKANLRVRAMKSLRRQQPTGPSRPDPERTERIIGVNRRKSSEGTFVQEGTLGLDATERMKEMSAEGPTSALTFFEDKMTGKERNGFISSRVKKLFEKASPSLSNFILKKKSLRRSILPIKTGRLFFEPTPQMIFKNILSKNSKKREIFRKAFLHKAFLPQRLEPWGGETQSHGKSSSSPRFVKKRSGEANSSGLNFKSSNRLFHRLEPTGPGTRTEPKITSGSGPGLDQNPKGVTSLRGQVELAAIRSKVSWSVSMKKVTPYTQVTYNIHGYWRTNQNTLRRQRPAVKVGDWVAAGDLLADSSATLRGELCVGQNILVGYVPWEGYNFEDAIVVNERLVEEDIYTSILIDRYEMEAAIDAGEKITRKIPDIKPHLLKNLDLRGIICVGTWVEEDDILVGKILPVTTELQGYSKLLADIYQIAPPVAKDVSFRVPDRVSGRVLECSVSEMIVRTPNNQSFATPWKVTLYLVEKRRMKLGDKMSGRHGNKGIVSIILPPQDMPFLPDGTPLDVALNPLGVPSRMNVGQLLESLLGLAGKHLHQKYRIPAFDEMYGEDFSRRIVYDKLLEASQKTQKPWLFNPNFPGKMMLRDGRTGEYFHQPILVGYPYMLKLIHMVDDKMHARATGPYTMVTQQPLKGRANRGGQRIGEMEVWAVEAFAASYALQELLTLKSDDISGRNHFLMSFLKRKKRTIGGIPDAFRVLMHELQSLCFHVHYTEDYRLTYPTLLESSHIPETPIPGNYGRG